MYPTSFPEGQQSTTLVQSEDSLADEQEQSRATFVTSAPFACNVCKRNYTRVDHLARHYRSHTREKPFPCDVCGKHFSRADLLRRHAAGHTDGAVNKRKRQSSPSARVSIACAACSAAKLKCKEEKPCRRCQQKGIECVTPAPDHSLSKQRQAVSAPNISSMDVFADAQRPLEHAASPFEVQPDSSMIVSDAMELDSQVGQVAPMSTMAIFTEQQPSSDALISDTWFPDDKSLGDFLNDVMMPISPANVAPSSAGADAMDTTVRDVLDFGIDANFDLNDLDFGLLNSYNTTLTLPIQQSALEDCSYPPSRGEEIQGSEVSHLRTAAFQRSLWRWTPGKHDQGNGEQINLSLPSDVGFTVAQIDRPCEERLGQQARDKIMAMLFNICEQTALSRIVSQFPSVEILDHLMQTFLASHASRSDSYVHVPTFQPNSMRPELVAMAVSCGAVLDSNLVIQKLGFALQEAVRLAIPVVFERDNSMTRDLQLLQSYCLELDVGLWSGNKRKMEIAESHSLPMVTMLRRSGRFRKHRPAPAAPTHSDSPAVLDNKWRVWVEVESFKRLAHESLIHDSKVSMSFLVPSLITHAETSMELPASKMLWKAKTASAWRDAYLSQSATASRRLPNLTSCLHDPHAMLEVYDQVDLSFSVDVILSLIWRLIWDARQLNSMAKQHSTLSTVTMSLVSGHWQQDLSQLLRNFRMAISDAEVLSSAAAIVHEHLLLNIHVSFEELSVFAGKEGSQEARRVLPLLRQWVDSQDSRQAVWHAGQILREATTLAPDALRDFHAIALYHAGLTLWAYGLLSNETSRSQKRSSRSYSMSGARNSTFRLQDVVYLDGSETPDTQKFIALNRALPVIRRRPGSSDSQASAVDLEGAISLSDPKAVMETVIGVLHQNHGATTSKIVPPLVENLTHLMQDLSRAANKVNKKR